MKIKQLNQNVYALVLLLTTLWAEAQAGQTHSQNAPLINKKIQTKPRAANNICEKPTESYNPNALIKIDNKGNYCWFPGLTIVSTVSHESTSIWEKIHEGLVHVPGLTESYSLLPAKSYHMTAINLFTERWDNSGNWTEFITHSLPWLQSLYKAIQTLEMQPKVTPASAVVSEIIYIPLHLEQSQLELLYHLANHFQLTQRVPSEFHITLGYKYKNVSDETLHRIRNDVQALIKNILDSVHVPIQLEEPKLCYFHDMTEFIPWSGEHNPFTHL